MAPLEEAVVRPSIVRWTDIPLFAVIVLGTMYAVVVARTHLLLGLLGVAMVLGVLVIFFKRWRLYRAVSFTTRHGLHVVCRDGQVIDPAAIESFTDWLISKWRAKTRRWQVAEFQEALKGTIVLWEPCPGSEGTCKIDHSPRSDFDDLIHPREKLIRVCYHSKVKSDALAHAVGHVFLRNLMFTSSDVEQDKFMKELDLP